MNEGMKQIGILIILIVLFVIGIIGLMSVRKNISKAPTLEVNLEDSTQTDQEKITISGKTNKSAKLTINGQEIPVSSDGTFSVEQALSEGENTIKAEATLDSKTTTVEKKVTKTSVEKNVVVTPTPSNGNSGNQVTTPTNNGELNSTGPVENILGIFGLTMILVSYLYYRETKLSRSH